MDPSLLEWMPSGAKIATVCDRKALNEELLKWNCSSDLLAAVVRSGNYDSVKIWSFSSNHWYLKHEIKYPRKDGVRFMWDQTKSQQLICWSLNEQVTVYKFIWVTAVMDESTALVIDGSNILVTPLSLFLMPPPMHLFSLNFPNAVREMAFYSMNGKNHLAVFLSNNCLCVAEFPTPDAWESLEGKEFSVEPCASETPLGSFVHIIWLDSHMLLAVSHHGFSNSNCYFQTSSNEDRLLGYYLQEIELTCSEDNVSGLLTCSGWHAKVSYRNLLEGLVMGIAPNPAKECSTFVQFDGGEVSEFTSKSGINKRDFKHDELRFSSSCPWMNVVLVGATEPSKVLLFGLDDMGWLHVGRKILCSNCSSFSFYSNLADNIITHLILATKQDLLFIVDISDILHGESELTYENFIHIGSKRKEEENISFINIWERGAKIIGVLYGDEAAVVLQTNRGNLECICPRKLVLVSIVNALNQRRFRDALLMVRRHRIDFNVIVDYCGLQMFNQSASEFVMQEQKNLLTNDFKGSDASIDANDKVSSVLLAIRRALEEQVIREMELSGSSDPRQAHCPSAEEALKNLLWLSDSEAVFEAALGLYDLNLAAIVALNSQRDPKEFLPFLQELEHMPMLLMHYNIDLRLHWLEKVLKHIVSAGDVHFSDCMNLMKKNPQIFPLGLQLITDPTRRGQVLEAWGDHLSDEKCFEDAAATYLCCVNLQKALKANRECGNWSGVLTVAGLLKLEKSEVMQLAHELYEELQALGKPGDAAKIALEYCGDTNAGINLLISARDWEEALRVAFLYSREDLVSVRRLLLAAKLQSEERSINDLDDDTTSEASSTFSGMCLHQRDKKKLCCFNFLTAASRARDARRQRSRGKIRPGSPGEEMALVEHLKAMSLTAGAKKELKSLLVSLVMLGEEETARKVQHVGENFQLSYGCS
ncbi:Elongator complex protein 1 [Hibiscus syriacus]|uniref:Elongator complex protein 1 n=1 Tax=Hibiscus syriacus TaxID=106335 RepID=A0A6A2XLP3_HIBSY|nr:Elongator complex protein 1 [Hibiscus syriacus]